jgi:nickel-dependent lactate racemase
MNILLKYGREKIPVKLNDGDFIGYLKPKKINVEKSERQIIIDSLKNPVKSRKLSEFIKKNDKVLIAIPDKTRISRLSVIFPIILKEFKNIGIKKENIKIIFSNGSHSSMDENEKKSILGEKYYKLFKIFENNAFDERQHIYFGKTKRGTSIFLNKILADSDKIITIGSVTHHYFAGFGGGVKMIMPGLAYYKTIEQNHKRSISKNLKLNKYCKSGELKNNPVYEDLINVMNYCPPIFSLNFLLDEKGKIIFASSGNVIESHKKTASKVNKKYRVGINEKADLVICSTGGYPKDINLIQTHKSIHNAYQAVKHNGVIICLAECIDGIGSKTFLDWFNYDDIILKKKILTDYSLNAQTAISFMEKCKNVKIILVTKLNSSIANKVGFTSSKNFDEAYKIALRYLKKDFSYYVIDNSSLVLPYLKTNR